MLDKIIYTAIEAGKIALSAEYDKRVSSKEGRANFVTEYDKRVQNFIITELAKIFPCASFLGEEENELPESVGEGLTFIIDPIDGTTNFIRQNPNYAVSIGVLQNLTPILGVVYSPACDLLYYAEYGKGAYVIRNGVKKKLQVSNNGLDGAIIGFGTSPYNEKLLIKSFDIIKSLLARAADIRRSGSAALDICYVAEGIFDLMFELKLNVWDFCAASLILSEAGGYYSDHLGNAVGRNVGTSFICGSPKAYAEAIEFFRSQV